MCVRFFSPFFSRPNVSMCLGFQKFSSSVCTSSLSTNKKKLSLSRRFYNTHFRSLFLFAFKTTFYARSCSLAAQRESLLPKKKEEHQKHPQSCVVLTLFSAKVRARFENERERERDGELFLRRERDLDSTFR